VTYTIAQRAQAELELRRRRKQTAPQVLSFRDFVAKVRPSYQWYRHCIVLADALQQVADGTLKRLMVFMPPRYGKSELVSRLFTAYHIYRNPELTGSDSVAILLSLPTHSVGPREIIILNLAHLFERMRVRSSNGKRHRAGACGRRVWAAR
jgi:hypothetical protein